MSPTQSATWAEIHRQPALWDHLAREVDWAQHRGWIAAQGAAETWLLGAGSSAYVGDIVAAALRAPRAVPTTDLVSRPALLAGRAPLTVQFGRSGDSPETVGALDALDAFCPRAPRLHVTCNPQGQLATRPAPGPLRLLLLPEEGRDDGFAMTASFTGMLLAALALLAPEGPAPLAGLGDRLRPLLPAYAGLAQGWPAPRRLALLGAGPLAYAAREGALKVMELTRGRTACLWDSTLGFRHGPKGFVQDEGDMLLFLSPDPGARRYDLDLLAELGRQFPGRRILGLGPGGEFDPGLPEDPAWAAAMVLPFVQILAVLWAAAMGIDVDDPFRGAGTLARVVSGVTLYPP
jgi:tagatose-6-phosphate ketose/aldose isomerase